MTILRAEWIVLNCLELKSDLGGNDKRPLFYFPILLCGKIPRCDFVCKLALNSLYVFKHIISISGQDEFQVNFNEKD